MRLLVFLIAAWVGACDRGSNGHSRGTPSTSSTAPEVAAGALEVPLNFAGCDAVLSGPRCELAQRGRVTFWFVEPPYEFRFVQGGSPLQPNIEQVGSGYRAVLELQATEGELVVELPGGRTGKLPVSAAKPQPELESARKLKAQGALDAATDALTPLLQSSDELTALHARQLAARIEIQRGNLDKALPVLLSTADEAHARGRISEASDDVFAAVFAHIRRFDLEAAKRLIELWAPRLTAYPTARVLIAMYRATIAGTEGDVATAEHEATLARREAERLGETRLLRLITRERANWFADVGRLEDAAELNGGLISDLETEAHCGRANVLARDAWIALRLAATGHQAAAARVSAALERARVEELACGDAEVVFNGLLNEGLWALANDDIDAAERVVQQLAAAPQPTTLLNRAWSLDIRAQVALRRGQLADAKALFERELALGEASGALDSRLRGMLGLGHLALEKQRPQEAFQHYATVFDLLKADESAVRLGDAYWAARQDAAAQLVGAALRYRKEAFAFDVALAVYRAPFVALLHEYNVSQATQEQQQRWRKAVAKYARVREELDRAAANDWQLSKVALDASVLVRREKVEDLRTELRSTEALLRLGARAELPSKPAVGEVWILPFPLEGKWVVFVATHDSVRAVVSSTPLSGEEPVAAAMSGSLYQALTPAKWISVFPVGASKEWDFAAWRLGGKRLIEWGPIVYRALADGPGLPESSQLINGALVADARSDLPEARVEGEKVQAALALPRDKVLIGEAADASRVARLIESSDWFHYAGHARAQEAGDPPALLLAGREELGAWELSALARVPKVVVLSACGSGAADNRSFGSSFSLASAFLLRGSQVVIASRARVSDRETAQLQTRFYEQLRRSSEGGVVPAFWRAQLQTALERPELGDLFRVFVR